MNQPVPTDFGLPFRSDFRSSFSAHPVETMETELLVRGADFAAPPAASLPNPDREEGSSSVVSASFPCTLQGMRHYCHLTDKGTEAPGAQVTYPRSYDKGLGGPGSQVSRSPLFNLGKLRVPAMSI